ncbi:MAG TPA: hypothetical protein VK213_00535 [Bacteroidales bacterium]|nr:hypothetical protein [Bacteroidales bacterium]
MNNKLLTFFSLLIVAVFIGYIVFDTVKPAQKTISEESSKENYDENWEITDELYFPSGTPCAVAVSSDGKVIVGGKSFISCFDRGLKNLWSVYTDLPVTAVTTFDDFIYASTRNSLLVLNTMGAITEELGPWNDNSIITSIAAGQSTIAIADANNKAVYIIDKGGEVLKILGNGENEFIIPSPYFDIVNSDSGYVIANTGLRRLEKWNLDGEMVSYFGESGLAADAFCGCCNPAHFAPFPGGFITAEKGINRIKVIDSTGKFVEFISAKNNFKPSIPLDIATDKGETVYAVNPSDSKLYVYKKIQHDDPQ